MRGWSASSPGSGHNRHETTDERFVVSLREGSDERTIKNYATEATEADSQKVLAALCNAGGPSGYRSCVSDRTATR